MKIRAKFSKTGRIKYVGHLDLLRFFQRVIKSINLPISYSQGFNPHPLIYFAQALSVGITSDGEYVDVHLDENIDIDKTKDLLNEKLPEGFKISEIVVLEDSSKNCMAITDMASYTISCISESEDLDKKIIEFYNKDSILATRKSKKKEKTIDLKEFIYKIEVYNKGKSVIIDVNLATGSRKNLNAKLFIETFIKETNTNMHYSIHRNDLFVIKNGDSIPLSKIGVLNGK